MLEHVRGYSVSQTLRYQADKRKKEIGARRAQNGGGQRIPCPTEKD